MTCPRCSTLLGLVRQRDFTLQGCTSCGGVWLNSVDAQRFAMAPPADVVERAAQAQAMAPNSPPLAGPINCPICAQSLSRHRVERAGVEVDFCAAHGTWFDGGELCRVASPVATT